MKSSIVKRNNKTGTVYRIILRYTDEYGNPATKETTYRPEPGVKEARAEVFAELYAEKFEEEFLNGIEEKRKEIELDKKNGGPIARMTFKELAKEWLDSKYDESNPTSPNNISYKYYKKSLVMIDEYNDEFGDVRVKDITHEVIYKYYKKLNAQKKIITTVKAKANIRDVFAKYGFSYRYIIDRLQFSSFSLNSIVTGKNVIETTAKKLCKITGIPFDELFDKTIKEEPYAEYTKWGKKKLLKAIFEFAISTLRIISDNPAKDNTIKGLHVTKRRESLSEEQAIKFYEATKDFEIMIQTAMHLSLLTGMRPAEMGGLEWRDVDFSYKTITIERNAIDAEKYGVIIKGTKTNRSRTISIPEVLVEQLLKYRSWQEKWKVELGEFYKDEGQVFSHPDGGRITTPTFNKWFKRVRDAAGLPDTFTLYNLRHTNLSILVGYVPITTVAQRAGHSTIKTTEEYYIHRVSEADMIASEKLNSVFETAYLHQEQTEAEKEIEEYKHSLEKMKQLGFKTLEQYFEYLKYMKDKGYKIEL